MKGHSHKKLYIDRFEFDMAMSMTYGHDWTWQHLAKYTGYNRLYLKKVYEEGLCTERLALRIAKACNMPLHVIFKLYPDEPESYRKWLNDFVDTLTIDEKRMMADILIKQGYCVAAYHTGCDSYDADAIRQLQMVGGDEA